MANPSFTFIYARKNATFLLYPLLRRTHGEVNPVATSSWLCTHLFKYSSIQLGQEGFYNLMKYRFYNLTKYKVSQFLTFSLMTGRFWGCVYLIVLKTHL